VSRIFLLGATQTQPATQARVSARVQRAVLSALMTLVVALVDRRLRKALDRSRPV
jgi:hypothetical protein